MSDQNAPAPLTEGVIVAETRLGKFQIVARGAGFALLADEPVAVGGLGSGPDPYDLLSSALGACTAMTIRLYAERKGWPLARVQVGVRHTRATLETRDRFERAISLEGPLDDAQRARLLEIAERCPVHQTLERGAEIQTSLSAPASPAPDGSQHMRDMQQACVSAG